MLKIYFPIHTFLVKILRFLFHIFFLQIYERMLKIKTSLIQSINEIECPLLPLDLQGMESSRYYILISMQHNVL